MRAPTWHARCVIPVCSTIMPAPITLRGLPAMHQRQFVPREDEKMTVSTMSPPSSSSSSIDHSPASIGPKRSRQETCRLVKEAMEMSVEPHSSVCFSSVQTEKECSMDAWSPSMHDGKVICTEVGGAGLEWSYTIKQQSGRSNEDSFHIIRTNHKRNPVDELVTFIRSCVVPEGYPESVAPSYAPYMKWRAMKYLFGGAMSVFTTRSLLHAVGASRGGSASTAMAVNWVIKDGAGRIGKLLFARHGKRFDSDMKQLRFTGDLLMELGAAVELATVAAPHLFLPLACAANIAKNVAAVSSTSTRAPIYKAFARWDNIGDVTAKGECISNIADLVGTGLGILISRRNPSLMATFAVLSCGYLSCSYQEIKSVLLPTLNRARFKVAVQSFLDTGRVSSVIEGNQKERIFAPPWVREKPFVLGARVMQAFQTPYKFLDLLPLFEKENYLVTFNSMKGCAYVVLKEKATSDDVIKATFHAQVLENILQMPSSRQGFVNNILDSLTGSQNSHRPVDKDIEAAMKESCKHVVGQYETFKHQARSQGWTFAESMLNAGITRLYT